MAAAVPPPPAEPVRREGAPPGAAPSVVVRAPHRVARPASAAAADLALAALDTPEILLTVLSHLDHASLLRSLRVSSYFAAVAVRLIWRSMSFHNFHGFLGLLEVAKVLSRRPPSHSYGQYIRSLTVHYSNAQKGLKHDLSLDRPLALLAAHAPHVRELHLHVHDASKLSLAALRSILTFLPSLAVLDLSWSPAAVLDPLFCSLPDVGALPHLRELAISSACLGDAGLAWITAHAHALVSISLRVDPELGPRTLSWRGIVDALAVRHHATLQRLELKGVDFPDASDYAAALPFTLPALSHLHLTVLSTRTAPTSGFGFLGLARAAAASLTHLCLVGIHGDALAKIAPVLRNLTSLELLHCPGLDVPTCRVLAASFPLLRQFRLAATELGDAGLCALAGLDSAAAASEDKETDSNTPALPSPSQGAQQPQKLQSRAPRLGGCLGEVRDLDLQSVHRLTDAAFQRTAQVLTKLRWIRFIDCPHLTDASVLTVCHASPAIETVHLAGPHFTGNVYWLCAPLLAQLSWLVVEDLGRFDAAEWHDLVDCLPQVARAVHNGWLLSAHALASAGAAGGPAALAASGTTGTTTATMAGSPFGPVLLTSSATAAAAAAAMAAVSSPIPLNAKPSATPPRRALFRPAVDTRTLLTPNQPNPYVMAD
ncbi:hypothetical protein H9P43_008535 [Blastocladiella emersonii ATCC 22665]|nr:hypothetical protein H9P43_008535 [Blastocladiella emersonii ATCC 22665]